MRRVLHILSGSKSGQVVELDRASLMVGSGETVDLFLPDPGVGVVHAVIESGGDGVLVRNLDSLGETYINGDPIRAELLYSGDQVQIGPVRAVYREWVPTQRRPSEGLMVTGDGGQVGDVQAVPGCSTDSNEDRTLLMSLSDMQMDPLSQLNHEPLEPSKLPEEKLLAVYQINRQIDQYWGDPNDPEVALLSILEVVVGKIDGCGGIAVLAPFSGETDEVVVSWPNKDGLSKLGADGPGQTIHEYVMASGEPFLCHDVPNDPRLMALGGELRVNGAIRSAICVPLQGQSASVGAMCIYSRLTSAFSEEDLDFVGCIVNMAGKVVENTRLHREKLALERLAALGRTVAATTHYMKNLLTGLTAGAELVDMGLEDNLLADVKAGWAPIRRNIDLVNDLVLNMLDFSKPRKPFCELMDVGELVESLFDLVRHRAAKQNISFHVQTDTGDSTLSADHTSLHRALLNLLVNAVDAMPADRHGNILVRIFQPDARNELAISISDDGMGIDPAILPHVFELFTSTKGARGTGFGLPVTRKIISEHRGRIQIQSQPNVGTTFTIFLPRSLDNKNESPLLSE